MGAVPALQKGCVKVTCPPGVSVLYRDGRNVSLSEVIDPFLERVIARDLSGSFITEQQVLCRSSNAPALAVSPTPLCALWNADSTDAPTCLSMRVVDGEKYTLVIGCLSGLDCLLWLLLTGPQNHLEERLLVAGASVVYPPPLFWGRSRSIPQCMVSNV